MQAGDTLGVVAPASFFDPETFKKGLGIIEDFGFHTYVPEEIYQKESYLAGSDRKRADTLNRLFSMGDIDGIICARGGYGSMRILPLLDYGDSIYSHMNKIEFK